MSLESRGAPTVVVVTGASRGIGLATCAALLPRGLGVVGIARTSGEFASLVEAYPGRAHFESVDLSDAAALEDLAVGLVKRHPRIDGLVACAGTSSRSSILEVASADLEHTFAVNFTSQLRLLQIVAQNAVRQRSAGSIVLVGSTLGIRPVTGTASYAASKAALHSLAGSAALDLAPHKIRVNAVVPGLIDTDMLGDRDRGALTALQPLNRVGTAAEVAHAIAYLLCDAHFTTGSLLRVDGGQLAGQSVSHTS